MDLKWARLEWKANECWWSGVRLKPRTKRHSLNVQQNFYSLQSSSACRYGRHQLYLVFFLLYFQNKSESQSNGNLVINYWQLFKESSEFGGNSRMLCECVIKVAIVSFFSSSFPSFAVVHFILPITFRSYIYIYILCVVYGQSEMIWLSVEKDFDCDRMASTHHIQFRNVWIRK